MKRLLSSFILAVIILGFAGGAFSVKAAPAEGRYDLFVSPDGSDEAQGTLSDPLKTVGEAKERLKALGIDTSENDTVTVWLREGSYSFSEPLVFDESDLENVTYAAYTGERVVFSAANEISGFYETEVNGKKAFAVKTDMSFSTLYHPEKRISTPRFPETGCFTVKSVDHADDLFTEETTYWDASRGNTSFNADTQQVGIVFSQPEAVYCRITHAWLDEIAQIRFYDAVSGKVGLGRPATYAVSPGDVYWFENVFEALDSPGEWYLDREDKTLYYVPFEGETPEELTLLAPVSPYIMSVDGCDGLTFESIRFSFTEWTLSVPDKEATVRSEYNIDDYQASTESDSAINIQNTDFLSFINCEFTDIGNTAVKYIKNCHDCTVRNCIFRNIGSTALAVYGENVSPGEDNADEAMSGFHIINNLVEAYGRNTYESTGVHLMYVKDSEVCRNEIHDGYYTGLSCGWKWGHEYQVTKNIRITDNLIYDIGQGWLSDLGGMYLLGEQQGTVIARNVIYNVTRGKGKNDYGGNGLYTDAGSSFFTIEQNLIYDCAATGINIGGYNLGHTVKNNIVAYCKLSAFDPGLGDGLETDHTCDCTGNIFYSDDAPVILNVSETAAYSESGNILWDETNGKSIFGSNGYSGDYAKKTKISRVFAKLSGYFTDDIIADPLFTDPQNRDFTLRKDSPALADGVGFEYFDITSAGCLPDAPLGCGSEYERGSVFRFSDLSAYENACSSPRFPYVFSVFGKKIAPALTALLLAAAMVFNVIYAVRKRSLPLPRRVTSVLCAPAMLALMYPLYLSFAAQWLPVLYVLSIAAFLLFAAVPPWQAIKKLPIRIVFVLIMSAAYFAVTLTLNNLYRMGEGLALNCAELITALPVFVCSAILARRPKD